MLHACGQLEILTNRVEKLFTADDISAELKSIVIELHRIYSFVEEINETFQVSHEFIHKAGCILLPISIFEVLEAFREGEVSVEFVVFIIGSMVIMSAPCNYSEMPMEKGEMLRMAVYSCGWERTYDRRTRKMIAILLGCASRPIALRTIFKTLNLETLTDVYQTAYAILNLMNTMWK